MADPFALPPADAPEWVARPDGMKVWDVTVGEGAEVKPNATVKVHYTGWLLNGTVFDSSKKRNQPISFGLHQVIKGWTEAMQLMKEGGKWELYIKSELGYGNRGAGGSIPGGAVLIFVLELLEVKGDYVKDQ